MMGEGDQAKNNIMTYKAALRLKFTHVLILAKKLYFSGDGDGFHYHPKR